MSKGVQLKLKDIPSSSKGVSKVFNRLLKVVSREFSVVFKGI